MSIVKVNSTNGLFDSRNVKAQLYTVTNADGYSSSTTLHGTGAAAAASYESVQLQGSLKYTVTGKIVHVQGVVVLDMSQADPAAGLTTQELRVAAVPNATLGSTAPLGWSVGLPLPAYGTGSQPLLDVEMYDEDDVRLDGDTGYASTESGTGPVKARILPQGELALLGVSIAESGNGSFRAPVAQGALTVGDLSSMDDNWEVTGSQLRFVIHGAYLMQ